MATQTKQNPLGATGQGMYVTKLEATVHRSLTHPHSSPFPQLAAEKYKLSEELAKPMPFERRFPHPRTPRNEDADLIPRRKKTPPRRRFGDFSHITGVKR